MLGYMLVTIGSLLFIHEASSILSPGFVLLMSALLATFAFHLLNLGRILDAYRTLLRNPWTYLAIMVCSVVLWFSTFWGDANISPFFVTFTVFGGGAACAAIRELCTRRSISTFTETLPVLLVMTAFLIFSMIGNTSAAAVRCLIIIAVSVASYLYPSLSCRMSRQGLTGSQILATRFWLLIACLVPTVAATPYHQSSFVSFAHTGGTVLTISIITFLIPVFCYQKAVIQLGTRATLLMCCLIPGLTLAAQLATHLSTITSGTWPTACFSLLLAASAAWQLGIGATRPAYISLR